MISVQFRRRSRQSLIGGFVGSLASVGLTIYLFGVFQDALVESFGTNVATFAWAPTLFMLVSGVLSPLIGRSLATRGRAGLSIKHVMLVGAIMIGLGLIVLSRMQALLSAAGVFVLLVVPGAILLGPLLGQAMITNWFTARRGWALGIVSAGTTVGGMLTPPLAAFLIESLGWRDAMAILGVLAIAIVVPCVWFLVRDRPEDVGEHPDGVPPGVSTGISGAPEASSTGELLRDPYLWLVGMTFGLLFSAGMISTIFTVPYATQLGLPLLGGAFIASVRAGSAACGKIVLGTLSDRLGIRGVLYAVIATEVVLTSLLVQTRDPVLFTLLGVAIGFVGGSPLPLKAALVGSIFGRANFPAAMGLVQTAGMPFQLFMVPLAGAIYQSTGTYAAVFGLTIPCFLLAGVCLAFIRTRPEKLPPTGEPVSEDSP